MKIRILLRPAADRDIADQADYLTQHQDLRTGLRFYRAAEETFQLLARQPEMGKQTDYQNSFLTGMRMFPVKRFPNHLVFYLKVDSGIEIIRVLHSARDIASLFKHGEEDSEL